MDILKLFIVFCVIILVMWLKNQYPLRYWPPQLSPS